uniref:MICOS complex subunit n=2 Tax=Echeneis naucrates TaxID=173247 RepID=A0A665WIN6_ECHNA
MVAVPTVLGIASIRVYTVSEAPPDGLVAREKLNVYTPLPQCAEVHFVPERPGVIEGGLTTTREKILPVVQAVKGACVSVKRGGVNLYHAGEDAYYYLQDPPPGFLPRFGTVTMAGLLGMFLARKGSRFKRLAIPLGMISAAASVCYPAQAVTVLKVTGKKIYTAGQWSSTAVSSLLISRPMEPVAKEIPPSQLQPSIVSLPASKPSSITDSSSQSAAIPEKEVESAKSVPPSDEPICAISEITLSETSPDQVPSDISKDPRMHPMSAETETAPPSDKPPAAVESQEASNAKEAPQDVSNPAGPAESAEVESAAAFEEPISPQASDDPAVPVIKPAESESAAQPKVTVEEETPTVKLTPLPSPPPAQPAAENNKEGSGFKADPSLMDFGQSSPEDEDLYSTRS